ncbi:MAG: transketolase [Candidatus Berkelbacteria bacterium]|nr:MAG: transketolase [Candidatus Berkelbacteria bacterium]QQG52019.1 MAG: transketolase [Candidatus Berkelbacteria bacterium]
MNSKQLALKANEIRQEIIAMLLEAGSGHSAGPLGMADVFTALYFEILKIKNEDPDWSERDRLVLSCGHICPVLYATLALRGFFPRAELKTLRQIGSRLQGHPHNLSLPGVETSSGPLGQGVSQAIGMALAAKLKDEDWRTYLVMSDGEHNEGQSWEGIMYAGARRLHNLTAIVDRNNIQIDGHTEDVLPLEPLLEKYQAFNWHVIEADGHNFDDIISSFRHARAVFEKPTAIIFHTIPGKGVDFMEQDYKWHGTPPDKEQAHQALNELRTLRGKIQGEHE